MRTNIILLPATILFAILLGYAIEPARSVLYEYYDIQSGGSFSLGAWLLRQIEGFFGGLLCFFISRKMRLKALRFAVCGYLWWGLILCFLAIYPYVKGENKYRHYNYYALALGGLFLVLYVFGTVLHWYLTSTIGALS